MSVSRQCEQVQPGIRERLRIAASNAFSHIHWPREHGSWAMWIVPLLAGAVLGGFHPRHLLLFTAVFFSFIAATPAVLAWKRPKRKSYYMKVTLVELVIASAFGGWLLPEYPLLLLVALCAALFFTVNLYFVRKKDERHLLNDLSGIIGLNLMVFASYYVGTGSLGIYPLVYLVCMVPFFFGGAFHVKSLIRERNNLRSRQWSLAYALTAPIVFYVCHAPLWVVAAYGISALRVLAVRQTTKLSIPVIGMIEIANTMQFYVLFLVAFRPDMAETGLRVILIAVLSFTVSVFLALWRTVNDKTGAVWFVAAVAGLLLILGLHGYYVVNPAWILFTFISIGIGQIIGGRIGRWYRLRSIDPSSKMRSSPAG